MSTGCWAITEGSKRRGARMLLIYILAPSSASAGRSILFADYGRPFYRPRLLVLLHSGQLGCQSGKLSLHAHQLFVLGFQSLDLRFGSLDLLLLLLDGFHQDGNDPGII